MKPPAAEVRKPLMVTRASTTAAATSAPVPSAVIAGCGITLVASAARAQSVKLSLP
jgi:hypothetical protein